MSLFPRLVRVAWTAVFEAPHVTVSMARHGHVAFLDELSFPTLTGQNDLDQQCITEVLLTIHGLAQTILHDNVYFYNSTCWEQLVHEEDLPYSPLDFAQLSRRYAEVICRPHLNWIVSIIDARPDLQASLRGDEARPSLRSLSDGAQNKLELGLAKLDQIESKLSLRYGTEITGSATVANVSLREVRLWCQLNTQEFHTQVAEANMDGLRSIMENDVPPLISALGNDRVRGFRVAHKPKSCAKVNLPPPWIYFICTGRNSEGQRLHKHTHVGCTKERFDWLPDLHDTRQDARNLLIGDDAIRAWEKRLDDVNLFESPLDVEGVRELQGLMMTRRWSSIPLNMRNEAKRLVDHQLRPCGKHVGQAFSLKDQGSCAPVGCCFLCKLTVAYRETLLDNIDEAKKVILRNRRVAHSCAEVPASASVGPSEDGPHLMTVSVVLLLLLPVCLVVDIRGNLRHAGLVSWVRQGMSVCVQSEARGADHVQLWPERFIANGLVCG
ncbi:hypothetical protein B0T10DRAFT_548819 [Thelonectria olida]|uniref:Uncharacterized protein n=1 Tax=Thelonectria olida TaxID=1576542 RepID=A0A9P9AQB4_9HYPO|nr:hypothetical protein B0T10DRAFT_548819 [Thelonectria olida]